MSASCPLISRRQALTRAAGAAVSLSSLLAQTPPAQSRKVAITIDDGPAVGAGNDLYGVFQLDVTSAFAVGVNGVGLVLRTDDGGATWQTQVSHSTQRLNDVYFVDSLRGWAVGNGGTIVHTATGGFAP